MIATLGRRDHREAGASRSPSWQAGRLPYELRQTECSYYLDWHMGAGRLSVAGKRGAE